jgi:hypothetical protein
VTALRTVAIAVAIAVAAILIVEAKRDPAERQALEQWRATQNR